MDRRRNVVLVTGSGGLIGRAAVRRLGESYTVVGFDRPGAAHPAAAADCIDVDVAYDDSVLNAMEALRDRHGERIASVIHLAAHYDFSGEPSPLYDAVTVRGTERLLRALQGFHVEQFVFSSTMLVHAPCRPGETINEDWPMRPRWAFPESVARTEQLIRTFHGTIPYVLLRIAGVYDDRGRSVPLAHQIQRIFERKLAGHVYPGDTECGQSFVHLGDLVDAIRLCVERRSRLPEELALLIGEPQTVSYDALQRCLGRLIHHQVWETHQIPKLLARIGAWLQERFPLADEPFIRSFMIDLADDHYALDISRAKQMLGWRPKRKLLNTVPQIVESLRSNPGKWYAANHLQPPVRMPELAQPLTIGAVRYDRPTAGPSDGRRATVHENDAR
jgi:nucleoside-diphosphate-sugar epimerase